ncbi:MAG: hypothetical protein AUJ52_11700 [Elusimicrobia bacterium CG1_02_63_36]|nr:MAG: hypothetical protein AUJ52_11700 [Elusimicrobia bacterium CG1_02_63_36]PIP83670.1 MAG: hypothetical protein COR54_08190 [Elusimicrobia bacterium CG22_combo_CG10-13_8_21_14_all_63_91]PJA15579.1 MAG: hypothetical protein COX66_09670 [Elusimicrobia bacterium CG_4_10_14_0_2_um_filter_63_34]PJB26512.1 MAG: hypothetical protein CO113_03060 [Elusimicrobia bacterium CG_4_9_14_3_um_filter_62_55]
MTPNSDNRSKTAAFLTHELRAPLTSILCALKLLQEQEGNAVESPSNHLLEVALRNAERLNLLIDDVMDSSKIQAGRMRMKPCASDPTRIACDTVLFLQPWAEHKRITLSVRASGNLPQVLTDSKRTVQALTNLISNALKFTPEGGAIVVSVERGTRDLAGSVVFSVSDTGPGLSPDEVKSVFRYFVQGKKGAQREDGTGLGLPLARSFVEILGGMMWAESTPGKGATFRFTLPQVIGDAGRPVPASCGAHANTKARP